MPVRLYCIFCCPICQTTKAISTDIIQPELIQCRVCGGPIYLSATVSVYKHHSEIFDNKSSFLSNSLLYQLEEVD